MTWYGILGILAMGCLLGIVSVWLDDHVFAELNKCEKCGHDPRTCEEKLK